MSKAEERACQYTGYCMNQSYSDFLKGYHQAEMDLELTWKDIVEIETLLNLVRASGRYKNGYKEVLKRFKDFRGRKDK